MPRIDINGLSIAYDLIGEGDKTITITPGSRSRATRLARASWLRHSPHTASKC